MKCSELIKKLTELKDLEGDLPVYVQGLEDDEPVLNEARAVDAVDSMETRQPVFIRIVSYLE